MPQSVEGEGRHSEACRLCTEGVILAKDGIPGIWLAILFVLWLVVLGDAVGERGKVSENRSSSDRDEVRLSDLASPRKGALVLLEIVRRRSS